MNKKKLEKNFIFHSNLCINTNKIKEFPTYYQDIVIKYGKYFSCLPFLPGTTASQSLWFNKYIKIDNKSVFNFSLSVKGINFVGQLFQNKQQLKNWTSSKGNLI